MSLKTLHTNHISDKKLTFKIYKEQQQQKPHQKSDLKMGRGSHKRFSKEGIQIS